MKLTEKHNPCIIVGNGPSLTNELLEVVSHYPSWAMNGIASIFPVTQWRPTYMVSVTTAITEPIFREVIYAGVAASQKAFIYDPQGVHPQYKDKITPLVTRYGDYGPDRISEICWSDNPLEWIGKSGTSTFAVMQLAVYMGYDPLILVGMDMNYSQAYVGNDPNHFPGYPLSTEVQITRVDYDELNAVHLAAHVVAKKICDAKGIRILNATPGVQGSIYPLVDLPR